jgi:DNA polymerase-3 subunit epsilon
MREIVFDTETTGLSPANGDRMVEIGCVELVNRVETGNSFHAYFNPERAMDPAAQEVHGLSDAFLANKPLFEEKVEDLLDFLGDSPLIAHNARFDFSFMNHELGVCGRLHIPESRMVDTLALARVRHPGAKHSLDALCMRFGIDRSHRVKHGALLDAQLLAQIYVELTGGRQIGLSLADTLAEERSTGTRSSGPIAAPAKPTYRAARAHEATAEEQARHRAFIAKLSNPLWLDGPMAEEKPADPVAIDGDAARA